MVQPTISLLAFTVIVIGSVFDQQRWVGPFPTKQATTIVGVATCGVCFPSLLDESVVRFRRTDYEIAGVIVLFVTVNVMNLAPFGSFRPNALSATTRCANIPCPSMTYP
jgi:hypothetical protein